MTYNVTSPKNNTTYYLHSSVHILRNHREQRIYYFAKTVKDTAIDALPEGYEVVFHKTGLPMLKKVR